MDKDHFSALQSVGKVLKKKAVTPNFNLFAW
jgi:hypothetical protein